MTDVTIKTLAAERQTSVERLVQQFADAGIRKSADDSVSAQEKQTLIDHLNQKNSGPDKLTLQRKTRSTLNIPGTGGKSKSVQIEVRKKRTFVKRDPQEAERLAAEEQAQREAEEQARREAEESAKREAQQKAEVIHLGTGVQRNRRQIQAGDSHILHNQCIYTGTEQSPNHLLRLLQFFIFQDSIDCHINPGIVQMGILYQSSYVLQ